MSDQIVTIQLSADEALVLFELLARFEEKEILAIHHPAEEAALWAVQCNLEKTLVEPFSSEYGHLLSAARERVALNASLGPSAADQEENGAA